MCLLVRVSGCWSVRTVVNMMSDAPRTKCKLLAKAVLKPRASAIATIYSANTPQHVDLWRKASSWDDASCLPAFSGTLSGRYCMDRLRSPEQAFTTAPVVHAAVRAQPSSAVCCKKDEGQSVIHGSRYLCTRPSPPPPSVMVPVISARDHEPHNQARRVASKSPADSRELRATIRAHWAARTHLD
jgi:hypothetical protein